MILLKREEFYLSWLSFLLIASLFSTGLHYFYGKNIYFIAAWGIQILMLLFFHSKIKQGSRKSLLFYPFSMIISIVFLIKLVIPSIRYNTDDFYKRIDNFIIKQEVSFYIKAYIPDHFKILCIFFFILFLFSFICIFYYYFIKVSLYKTQRFFNGFFSLTGISFILMLFFPLKEKHVVFLYMKDFDYLNRINYDLLFLNLSFFFPGLLYHLLFIYYSL